MSHTAECIRNFDANCSECIEWKKYGQGLNERRSFLANFWAHLDSRTESQIPRISDVNPRLKPNEDALLIDDTSSMNKENTSMTEETYNLNEEYTSMSDEGQIKCTFCHRPFTEDTMKIHLEWFHEMEGTNTTDEIRENTSNTSIPLKMIQSTRRKIQCVNKKFK